MMCATPVISFDAGTAQDVVINGLSGFKVPLKDSLSFGERLFELFRMDNSTYQNLRKSTLDLALQWNNGDKFVNSVEETYSLFKNKSNECKDPVF